MAKLNITTVRTLTLELTEEEAEWLHGTMQNPLHGQSPIDEDVLSATMRHEIYEVLNGELHNG